MKQTRLTTDAIFVLLLLSLVLAGCAANQPTANQPAPTQNPQTISMFRSVREGHAESVKILLATPGVDANARDERGSTPLIEAARFGHDDVVRALLARGADVKAKDNEGRTALSLAAQGGHAQTILILKQAGAVE